MYSVLGDIFPIELLNNSIYKKISSLSAFCVLPQESVACLKTISFLYIYIVVLVLYYSRMRAVPMSVI